MVGDETGKGGWGPIIRNCSCQESAKFLDKGPDSQFFFGLLDHLVSVAITQLCGSVKTALDNM